MSRVPVTMTTIDNNNQNTRVAVNIPNVRIGDTGVYTGRNIKNNKLRQKVKHLQ